MKATIGLFGFGVVGQGFYHILSQKNGTAPGRIARICVRDRQKTRPLPGHHFTFDPADILHNPEITHVIELTDRPDDAFHIVKTALQQGKTVISANKKMLSDRLEELAECQRTSTGVLLYEASACGSIPVFQNLERYYAHDEVGHIQGIFNGSTNYILTKMAEHSWSYDEALARAQALGFAETDPSLDVDAHDPASKLALLCAHALGQLVAPADILRYGIRTVARSDMDFAAGQGCKIRLIATASLSPDSTQLQAYVLPTLIPENSPFYALNDEYNGIQIQSRYMDKQVLTGKGAGSIPTGFAVLSDLAASVRQGATGYLRLLSLEKAAPNLDAEIRIYVRFPVPGDAHLLPLSQVEWEKTSDAGYQRVGRVPLRTIREVHHRLLAHGVFLAHWEAVNAAGAS